MIAMTTRSSTSVKPWTFLRFIKKLLEKWRTKNSATKNEAVNL